MPHPLTRISKLRPLTPEEQETLRAYWRKREQIRHQRAITSGERMSRIKDDSPFPLWLLATSKVESLAALRHSLQQAVPTRKHVISWE